MKWVNRHNTLLYLSVRSSAWTMLAAAAVCASGCSRSISLEPQSELAEPQAQEQLDQSFAKVKEIHQLVDQAQAPLRFSLKRISELQSGSSDAAPGAERFSGTLKLALSRLQCFASGFVELRPDGWLMRAFSYEDRQTYGESTAWRLELQGKTASPTEAEAIRLVAFKWDDSQDSLHQVGVDLPDPIELTASGGRLSHLGWKVSALGASVDLSFGSDAVVTDLTSIDPGPTELSHWLRSFKVSSQPSGATVVMCDASGQCRSLNGTAAQ